MREEFEQIVAESNVRGRPSIDMQAEILAQELVPPTVEAANVAVRSTKITQIHIKLMRFSIAFQTFGKTAAAEKRSVKLRFGGHHDFADEQAWI